MTKEQKKALALIKKYEGFRGKVYLDGNGIRTIGYGFTDPALIRKGKISQAEADARLLKEVQTRQNILRDTLGHDQWDALSSDAKAAFTSYHFNYPGGFKDDTQFMKLWRSGDYTGAINQVDAGMNDPKNPGLRPRRLEERRMLYGDPYLGGKISVLRTDGGKKMIIPLSAYEKPTEFESTWKPEQPTKTIYPLNNTTPESISSWSGADAPNATPRLKDLQEVRQRDLNRGVDVYGDPVSPFSLRLRLPSLTSLLQLNSPEEQAKQFFADALGISDMLPQAPSLFPRLKNGKLPYYRNGKDDFEEFKSSLPSNQRNTPEWAYPTRRYWELHGKPKTFGEAIGQGMYTYDFSDNAWHANSVAYNKDTGEYEFMKPNYHDTKMYEDAWYYSKAGEEFRKDYTKGKDSTGIYDKYVPRKKKELVGFNKGKLPRYADGNTPDGYPLNIPDIVVSGKNKSGYTQNDKFNAAKEWLTGTWLPGRKQYLQDRVNELVTEYQQNQNYDPYNIDYGDMLKYVTGGLRMKTPDLAKDYERNKAGQFANMDTFKQYLRNYIGWNIDAGINAINNAKLINYATALESDYPKEHPKWIVDRRFENPDLGAFVYGGDDRYVYGRGNNSISELIHELNHIGQRYYTGYDSSRNSWDQYYDRPTERHSRQMQYRYENSESPMEFIYPDKEDLQDYHLDNNDDFNYVAKAYKNGKSPIRIKPANRGKFTALKKRTGHSASWFKAHGTPAQKKMATFALNARKWKH